MRWRKYRPRRSRRRCRWAILTMGDGEAPRGSRRHALDLRPREERILTRLPSVHRRGPAILRAPRRPVGSVRLLRKAPLFLSRRASRGALAGAERGPSALRQAQGSKAASFASLRAQLMTDQQLHCGSAGPQPAPVESLHCSPEQHGWLVEQICPGLLQAEPG